MIRPTLVVLAAGMGSRYGGLKQLDAVGPHGETIIDYTIFDALRAGFSKVVFVIRRDISDTFHQTVTHRYVGRISVSYAYQAIDALPDGFTVPPGRTKPWGTGHAVLMAEEMIGDAPFTVVNADDFYGGSALVAAADHLCGRYAGDQELYGMVGYRLSQTLSEHGSVSRGICQCDAEGYLKQVIEVHDIHRENDRIVAADPNDFTKQIQLTGDEVVSMNLWTFPPSIFEHLGKQFTEFLRQRGDESESEFYIPAVVNTLIRCNAARVRVLTCDAAWFGVTFREDRPRVQQRIADLVKSGLYPSPLWDATPANRKTTDAP